MHRDGARMFSLARRWCPSLRSVAMPSRSVASHIVFAPHAVYAEYAAFAEAMADAVRPLSLGGFRRRLNVEAKADESPVTIADREVETALRTQIMQTYPTHGMWGEEFGTLQPDAEF